MLSPKYCQKVFKRFLWIASKNQAEIQNRFQDYVEGGEATSKGLSHIGNIMSMVLGTNKSVLGSQEWLRFHIWIIITLYYKMWKKLLQNTTSILLQNASGFLLQNATVLLQNKTKSVDFLTKCDNYYKMRRLLQDASVQTSIVIVSLVFKNVFKAFGSSPFRDFVHFSCSNRYILNVNPFMHNVVKWPNIL